MIKSIIKFARLRIVATCYALVFLGSTAAGGMNIKTILALIPLLAITIHANSINDYSLL
jgi:1,4-dihydroxy-2-naphthoate octaprenyltransferase